MAAKSKAANCSVDPYGALAGDVEVRAHRFGRADILAEPGSAGRPRVRVSMGMALMALAGPGSICTPCVGADARADGHQDKPLPSPSVGTAGCTPTAALDELLASMSAPGQLNAFATTCVQSHKPSPKAGAPASQDPANRQRRALASRPTAAAQ